MRDPLNADGDTDDQRTRDGSGQSASESSADVKAPFAPHEDDDSPFGDTDQHSTV
ncbi:MAG: hypothetical protein ABSH51_06755 [Solirubrobacteraceae bacterium]|jgi:hypothetical protein